MILPLQGVTPRYTLFPERCPGLAYRSPFGAPPLFPSLGVIDEVASLVEEWGWGWALGSGG